MLFYPRCTAQVSVVFDGRGGPDIGPILLEVQPDSANVALTGYHEADTWSIEFDQRVLPLDPDLIRSAVVAVHMWAAELYDEPDRIVPETRMVIGLADEGGMTVDEDNQSIRLEGRDYTGLLLDQQWDPRKRVPAGRPLDRVVQEIADDAAPPGASLRFRVQYESTATPVPPMTGGTRRATNKKGQPVASGKSVWDVIYELCLSHGFIVFVRGEDIVISDPQTQTAASLAQAPVIAYGHELESLEVRRRFAKERVPQIRVTGYNPKTRKRVEVLYPRKHEAPDVGLGLAKDERVFLPAPRGEYDEAALRRYAEIRYENMARAEASYKFGTRWLRTRNEADLFQLRGGRPVVVEFDPWNAEAMRALNPAQRVEHLLARGYSSSVAAVVAENYERLIQARQPHYTRLAEFAYAIDDGMAIAVEAVNYAYEPRELDEQRSVG
jgi:hypothetical protein